MISPIIFLIGLFYIVRTGLTFWVYVLISETTGRRYIGYTSDIERRLREHNDKKTGKMRYTRKQAGPWTLVYQEQFTTRKEAMQREKFLKSGQGREWLSKKLSWLSPPQAD